MKAKKALKRLNKVEALLTNVIDQFSGNQQQLRELLGSARASVNQAKETVNSQSSTSASRKTPAKAEMAPEARVTTNGRQGTPLAVAKRRSVTKRKGTNAVRGPGL